MSMEHKPQFIFAGSLTKVLAPPLGNEVIVYTVTDNGPLIDAYGDDELDAHHNIHQKAASFVEECYRQGVIEDLLV